MVWYTVGKCKMSLLQKKGKTQAGTATITQRESSKYLTSQQAAQLKLSKAAIRYVPAVWGVAMEEA